MAIAKGAPSGRAFSPPAKDVGTTDWRDSFPRASTTNRGVGAAADTKQRSMQLCNPQLCQKAFPNPRERLIAAASGMLVRDFITVGHKEERAPPQRSPASLEPKACVSLVETALHESLPKDCLSALPLASRTF